ncbi:hypothetical protein IT400_04135 [Candidatus Nomurabacteria bacterium]|nr:hypothetical protein [Candidatus Nomurabacteria bacterium]
MNTIKNTNISFWIKTSVPIVLFVVIITLVFINMRGIIRGVQISANIDDPQSTTIISEISGNAKNATYLSLNGREINLDKNGTFNEKIALPDGYSVVTIEAKDAFGKSAIKTMEIYKAPKGDTVAIGNITNNIINN